MGELGLLERGVYFDGEILDLAAIVELNFPQDLIFNRFELDLGKGMVMVLSKFREFTKFVQYRDKVTLDYIPRKIDELVTTLLPGAFANCLNALSAGVREDVEALQKVLVSSTKTRFSEMFHGHSLALAAAMILPGPNRLQFLNFEV